MKNQNDMIKEVQALLEKGQIEENNSKIISVCRCNTNTTHN